MSIVTARWRYIVQVSHKILVTRLAMMLRIGELQLDRTPSHQIANLMQAAVVHVLSSGSFPAFGTGTVAGIAVFSDDLRWWQILVPQNDSLGFILAGTQFGRCFRDRCACFHPVSLLHVPFLQHDLVGRHATVSFFSKVADLCRRTKRLGRNREGD